MLGQSAVDPVFDLHWVKPKT